MAGIKKPKHEQRRSLISVRATASEKSQIRKDIKTYKDKGVLSMSDVLLYCWKLSKGE